MRILYSIHLYPPKHNCGAEWMVHTMNREMMRRGHEIKVILHQANQHKITSMYDFEGVTVFPPDKNMVDSLFRWADIVITHLDYTKWTVYEAAKYKKPVFFITHNDTEYQSIVDGHGDIRIIYNSEWIKEKLNYKYPSFVFPPPTDKWYKIEKVTKRFITMVNLNNNKGAEYFYKWAKRLPQYEFLGIKGTYDNQIIVKLPNVTIVENTPDIRPYYAQTAILLVPSHYESWGRVASEAIYNGIPVIANPTHGLIENLGRAGIFIPRKDTDEMIKEITKLMEDEVYYKKQQKVCLERAAEQEPDYDGLERFLLGLTA